MEGLGLSGDYWTTQTSFGLSGHVLYSHLLAQKKPPYCNFTTAGENLF